MNAGDKGCIRIYKVSDALGLCVLMLIVGEYGRHTLPLL